ncbi:MAG: hypothetical protein ACRDN8_16315, partial [Thermoleophilaceae bacterium]
IVTESFVIAQLHLDNVFTGPWLDELAKTEYFSGGSMGGAMTGIELAARVKDRYEEGEIHERVTRALEEAVFGGASHIRAFVDVDPRAGRVAGGIAAPGSLGSRRDSLPSPGSSHPSAGQT